MKIAQNTVHHFLFLLTVYGLAYLLTDKGIIVFLIFAYPRWFFYGTIINLIYIIITS